MTNPRDRRRRLERLGARGDIDASARVLLERMGRGEVTRGQVRLAAALGDPRAKKLEPGRGLAPWGTQNDRVAAISAVALAIGDKRGLEVAFAIDCARRVEHLTRGEPAVALALEASERWLLTRTGDSAEEALVRAAGAHDVVVRERDRGWGGGRFTNAVRAARDAAFAAEDQRHGAGFSANAAESAADAAEDGKAEVAWQRTRLAGYALGEIRVPGLRGNPRKDDRRRLERRAARGDVEARRRLEAEARARRPLSPDDVDIELLKVAREVGGYLSELAPDVGRIAWDVASGGSGSCVSESRLGGEPRHFHVRVEVESSGRRRLATISVARDVSRGPAPRYETDVSASMSLDDAELLAWLKARGRPDRATGDRWIPTAVSLWFDLMNAREVARCGRCRGLVDAEELGLGWPVEVMIDDVVEAVCPDCYGNAAYCPAGHLLRADVDSSLCDACEAQHGGDT